MKIYKYPSEIKQIRNKLARRKHLYDRSLISAIVELFEEVAKYGDKAIYELTEKYDDTKLDSLLLDDTYIEKCVNEIPQTLIDAINHARKNIEEVNEYLMSNRIHMTKIRNGTVIGEKIPCPVKFLVPI